MTSMFRRKSRSGLDPRPPSSPPTAPSLPTPVPTPTAFTVPAPPSSNNTTTLNSSGHRVLRKGSATSLGGASTSGKARVVNSQVVPGRPSGYRSDHGHGNRSSGEETERERAKSPTVTSQIPYPVPTSPPLPTSVSSPNFSSYQQPPSTSQSPPADSPNAVYSIFPTPPSGPGRRSIASLYPSSSNLLLREDKEKDSNSLYSLPKSVSLPNVRRAHKAPSGFNILIAGARKTGKSTLINSIVNSIPTIVNGSVKKEGRKTTCEYTKGGLGGEKVSLNLIDTEGLEIQWGKSRLGDELEVERQLGGILRECEKRFEETLLAESQVIRPSYNLHDHHIHLLLYLIHPESISLRPKTSGRKSRISGGAYRRSLTRKGSKRGLNGDNGDEEEEKEDEMEEERELVMSEMDLRCLQKLARRVNVVPLLARSDELTSSQITSYKSVIVTSLNRIGLSYPPLSPAALPSPITSPLVKDQNHSRDSSKSGYSTADQGDALEGEKEAEDEVQDEVEERPVRLIRLKSTTRILSSPKKRGGVGFEDEGEESVNGGGKKERGWDELIPFATMSPEKDFVREFRYGTIDLLNPLHTDFLPFRTELLGAQIRIMKESTRLEKYEPFRTQRLIAVNRGRVGRGGGGGKEERELVDEIQAL